MTEHEIAQKAFSNNRERLKAERLARESAGPPAFETQSTQGEEEITDDSPEEAMDTPFLITASELLERQTMRRRKLHLSARSKTISLLVELGLKAMGK